MTIMSFERILYRDIPFSSEITQEEFYLFGAISYLYTKCETNKDKVIKIRTIGILENKNGCFYIKQIMVSHELSHILDQKQSIPVSMAYMNKPVRTMPHTVQLFGRLQWCKHPVIFAEIIQQLNVSVATMLNDSMVRATSLHTTKTHELY